MKQETNVIKLDNLDASKLPELQGLKDKQLELVKECPYIEIIDNSSYEVAKKHRTALLKGRTSLESQEKTIASKLAAFRKKVGEVTKELIDITLPHEEKQQEEVKRYEQIKENERIERERLEQLRVDSIKKAIEEIENECYNSINQMIFASIDISKKEVESLLNSDNDFQEFDYNFTLAKTRVETALTEKITSLKNQESERLQKIKIEEEKEAAIKKAKELQDQIDAQNAQIEKDRKEREDLLFEQEQERLQKEKKEKEKVFEVRKNRLAEIGLEFNGLEFTIDHKKTGLFSTFELLGATVLECDVIDFENLLTDSKNAIQEGKDKAEKAKFEKEAADKLEKENKAKSDKENKARVKRLAKDKAIYKKTLTETLGDFPIVFDADQKEVREFSERSAIRVSELYNELLTELENL